MNKKLRLITASTVASIGMVVATSASADVCADFTYNQFTTAVDTAYTETNHFGFGLPMWATLMNHTGKVCYVYSVKGGGTPAANGGPSSSRFAWLGSRVISAQKANSANAFSINGLSIPTGGVTVLTYEGGSLFGLQASNPVNPAVAYAGNPAAWGTETDGMVGTKPGGLNYFGGGVALYNVGGAKLGAVGVSGDTSCRDHAMAYRLRIALSLNNEPNDDGLELVDTTMTPLSTIFQQPACAVQDPVTNAGNTNDGAADDFGVRTLP